MLFIILSALLIIIGGFFAIKSAPPKKLTIFFQVTVLVFMTCTGLYLISDYFTGNGINEAVLFQIRIGFSGAGLGEYNNLFLFSILWSLATFGLVYAAQRLTKKYIHKKKRDNNSTPVRVNSFLATIFFVLAFITHPFSIDIVKLLNVHFTFLPVGALSETKSPLIEDYIPPVITQRNTNAPNLIFIYLEGMERTYFDEARFPGLIKYLRALEKQSISFSNIKQLWGTGWTIAGMTASQCGIPLVIPSGGNSMGGMEAFLPKATNLGDLLNNEGYHLVYMGGASLEFAGKGKFYHTHGFSESYGADELLPTLTEVDDYRTDWGLYDDTLYDLSYKKFETLSSAGKRFGIFLLTLDTHHPNGHISRSCQKIRYGDGSNEMLNAVACADWMAANFVKKILASKYAKNTVICLVSDHLALKNSTWDKLNEGPRRNFFMIIPPQHLQSMKITRPGSMFDIGATLLNVMGLKIDGLGLGRDLLDSNCQTFIEKHNNQADTVLKSWYKEFVDFWDFPVFEGNLAIYPDKQEVKIGGHTIKTPVLIELDHDLKTTKIKFPFYGPDLRNYVFLLQDDQPFIWIDKGFDIKALEQRFENIGKEQLCLFAGKLGQENHLAMLIDKRVNVQAEKIAKTFSGGRLSKTVSEKRRKQLNMMIKFGVIKVDDEIVDNSLPDTLNGIVIRSCGGPESTSALMFDADNSQDMPLSFKRGISLVGLPESGEARVLACLDLCQNPEGLSFQEPFSKIIERLKGKFALFAIVVHDSPVGLPAYLGPLFQGLYLKKWSQLTFRRPYIALILPNGRQGKELIGSKNGCISLRISSKN